MILLWRGLGSLLATFFLGSAAFFSVAYWGQKMIGNVK